MTELPQKGRYHLPVDFEAAKPLDAHAIVAEFWLHKGMGEHPTHSWEADLVEYALAAHAEAAPDFGAPEQVIAALDAINKHNAEVAVCGFLTPVTYTLNRSCELRAGHTGPHWWNTEAAPAPGLRELLERWRKRRWNSENLQVACERIFCRELEEAIKYSGQPQDAREVLIEVRESCVGPSLFIEGIEVRMWLGTGMDREAYDLAAKLRTALKGSS